ncbi:MAG: Gfo/Idh/MocA family oxidoreductase, partial [Micromonosporaceae bacterium]|nr:Gfo/Idh/MocA family oxidoreductase [Micromonosporaceae bacterium]
AGFVAGLRAAGHAMLSTVYDPDPEARQRFAAEHGVETVATSYQQLLEHCDLVIVCSPQQHHVPQAVMALDAGIHVLSEVPAAVSIEQAQNLVAAIRGSSARYMLAENYCYIRSNLVVAAMARAGLFGDLYYGEGEYLHEMRGWHTRPDGTPTWRYYWQVGRIGHTYPTHSLGPLLQWFGDRVTAVSCTGTGRHTDPEHAIDDTVLLLCRTSRGALLKVRFDLLSNRPHLMDYYSLQGTGGAYEAPRASDQQPRVYLHGSSPDNAWEPLEPYTEKFLPERYRRVPAGAGHWGADAWPVLEFIRSIVDDVEPPAGVFDALDMSLPGIVSENSAGQGGGWVHVPDPRLWTAGIGVEPGREAPRA